MQLEKQKLTEPSKLKEALECLARLGRERTLQNNKRRRGNHHEGGTPLDSVLQRAPSRRRDLREAYGGDFPAVAATAERLAIMRSFSTNFVA